MSIKTETNLKYSRIWIEGATNFNKINSTKKYLFIFDDKNNVQFLVLQELVTLPKCLLLYKIY